MGTWGNSEYWSFLEFCSFCQSLYFISRWNTISIFFNAKFPWYPYPPFIYFSSYNFRLSLPHDCLWLDLVVADRVDHHFVWILRGVRCIALVPVIAHSVCEDGPIHVECSSGNRSSYRRISFESALCLLIPEVKGSIRSSSTERAVHRVCRDGINSPDLYSVVLYWVSMTFERHIFPSNVSICRLRYYLILTPRPQDEHIEKHIVLRCFRSCIRLLP